MKSSGGKKLALCATLMVLVGCSKDIQNSDAVKSGVVDYLKQRTAEIGINMDAMDVTVNSVSFEKDVARATVAFTPKGMPQAGGMSMSYVLDRKGDKWVVKGRQTNPADPHGADGMPPAGGELPPGHPPAGSKE